MFTKQRAIHLSIVAVLLAALASPAAASGPAKLVGSWEALSILETGEEAPGLFTFNADHTWTATASEVALSNARGAWERSGHGTYTATNKGFVYGSDGSLSLLIKNTVELEVSDDSQSFTADFTTVISLPDGTAIDTFTGTSTGSRIVVESP